MTVRAVIFDLGHTLWDIRRDHGALARSYAELRTTLCTRLGRDDLPAEDAMIAAVGAELRRTYLDVVARDLELGDNQTFEQPASHTWVDAGLRTLGIELDEDALQEVCPPLYADEVDCLVCADGTREAVVALRDAGYRIGCVTNTLAYPETIGEMLARHGFAELMECVVVSSAEGYRKPHASLFLKAARELGAEAGEALFVGDSPFHDVRGAKRAGMLAALTHQYVARPHEGFDVQPDAIISHLRELPAVIRDLDAR